MYRIHARDAPSINVRKRSSCMERCFYTEVVITVVPVCNAWLVDGRWPGCCHEEFALKTIYSPYVNQLGCDCNLRVVATYTRVDHRNHMASSHSRTLPRANRGNRIFIWTFVRPTTKITPLFRSLHLPPEGS